MKDIYFHIEYYNKEEKKILVVSHPAVLVSGEICFDKYKVSVEHAEKVDENDKEIIIPGRINYKIKVYEKTWKQDKRFSRV